MATLGTDHTTARRVSLGMECVECGESFVRAHGTPTACTYCYPKMSLEERKVVGRATHGEETKEHFRADAKKRKQRNGE